MKSDTPSIVQSSKILSQIQIPERGDPLSIHVFWNRMARDAQGYARWNRKLHKHTFYEIHMSITGTCKYFLPKGGFAGVESDEFILFAPGTEHQLIDRSGDYNKYALGFDIQGGDEDEESAFVKSALGRRPFAVCKTTDFMRILVERSMWEAYHARKGFLNSLRAYLWLLLVEITRQIEPQKSHHEEIVKLTAKDNLYELVCQYVSDNISRRVTGDDVADNVHMSLKQLNRVIFVNYNSTVQKIIEKIKADSAKNLLLNTQLTLREIGEALGYSNEYNFSRFFKRVEGMAPGAFRRAR